MPAAPAHFRQMLPSGSDASPAELARVEKFLKGRLAAAAEHFNRDSKKGFQFLQASLFFMGTHLHSGRLPVA